MENKYNLNDVIYFVHQNIVGKGIISELILHYTQEKTIIKYIVRPYGLKDFVTLNEEELYDDLKSAKDYAIQNYKKVVTKEKVRENYRESKKKMKEKFLANLKKFDEVYKEGLKELEAVTEEFFENKEKTYQEKKENTNV